MGDDVIILNRRQRRALRPYEADLPSVQGGAAVQYMNLDPHRNLGQPGITRELPQLPDAILIATLVSLGCPRDAADQVRTHPGWRFNAVSVWCLVQDAKEGKHVMNARTGEVTLARDLVDGIRAQYEEARDAIPRT